LRRASADFDGIGSDVSLVVLAALVFVLPAMRSPNSLAKTAIPKPLRLLKIRN